MKDYRSKAEQAIEGLVLMKRNVKENSCEDYYLNCGIKALSKDVPVKVETHVDLRRHLQRKIMSSFKTLSGL